MDRPPPPPPPPHGSPPGGGPPPNANGGYRKSTDLPEGPYDIFIVPPHSSGSGFIYLPSLQCHTNSFLAGVTATLFGVALYIYVLPMLKAWVSTVAQSGGAGVLMLVVVVGVGSWAWGRSQTDLPQPPPRGTPRTPPAGGTAPRGPHHETPPSSGPNHTSGGGSHYQSFNGQYTDGYANGPHPSGQYSGGPYPGGNHYAHETGTPPGPRGDGPSRPPNSPDTPPKPSGGATPEMKNQNWEKAREETRRKEDIRRKMEEFRKKREEEEKEKQRQREKETREREFRERKEKREKERLAKEAAEKEAAEKAVKEQVRAEAAARFAAAREAAAAKRAAEKAAVDKLAAEKLAEKLAAEKLAAEKRAESVKQAAESRKQEESVKSPPKTPSPQKKSPPFPSAKTECEDDAYSFRPYDRPRNQPSASSVFSESSYAPSQSTARTTPPPSRRGPYSTKDPDKVIIAGVYLFNNAFMRTPVGQLVSGKGNVTDGLILRITTEGMFVDDDIRGVAQREWDVKAWTMKLVEVWCPQLGANNPPTRQSPMKINPFRFSSSYAHKVPSSEESDAHLAGLHRCCKNKCRFRASSSGMRSRNGSMIDGDILQNAELRGFHVVRASIRDQEGKKYVFILSETEAWKVALGLQRLRKGSQVRALGVCGLPANETNAILESLGYIAK
ncbi:hypothetical protein PAAG_01824 [Paracoccidioides lutzii Pb01]|uniref:Trans-sialidase n=1 Tax=Paracoccidioides lutzii (strain ATCC MYA-826 / Pb01) TaxID=502779 RepID=C1GTH9_PARBA|nr:hypothetical protein PAAG_01824 [Paracoccidioides lutzii Pb01]EEH39635.1 hypothetical protein PAAG_01824 [Paracoccidioides lutzii Pb01]